MAVLRSALLAITLLAGCSVLGSRIHFEQKQPVLWSVSHDGGGMYAPGMDNFSVCDSAGSFSLYCAQLPYVVSWGPMLLPLIPSRLYGQDATDYRIAMELQTQYPAAPDTVLAALSFAFNSPSHILMPRIEHCSAVLRYSPACPQTAQDTATLWAYSNNMYIALRFDIHPDSVRSIYVVADSNFAQHTGMTLPALELQRSDRLYYIPVTFFTH